MKLIVNGQVHDVSSQSLEALLLELEFDGQWLATAVNSELVRATDRQNCILKNGDRIEVLTPKQGG